MWPRTCSSADRRFGTGVLLSLCCQYVFGFLFIVFLILIITCAEITIVLCYFQVRPSEREDTRTPVERRSRSPLDCF